MSLCEEHSDGVEVQYLILLLKVLFHVCHLALLSHSKDTMLS